ncbi:MAG: LLM class flavin-dependent oxidoreductase [Chloroflexi bacterium]|nr:LLM class flavin-dependent oxidoreductase [Chloroflexota bacterium]
MPNLDLSLYQNIPPKDVVSMARLADEKGFKNLWFIDSPDAYPDIWVTAGYCAVHTSRIMMGPGVTNPLSRHPQVTASAALALRDITGGRSILGLGIGDSAIRQIGSRPAAVSEVEQCVDLCRERFKEKGVDIPIYIAATGPKITSYTCKEADGIITTNGGRTTESLRRELARIEEAAQEVGRDIKTLALNFSLGFAISYNKREAMDDMRGPLARQIKRRVKDSPETWPTELEHLRSEALKMAQAYNYRDHMQDRTPHSALVTDALLEAFASGSYGTPTEVLPTFKALWDEAKIQERRGLHITLAINPASGGRRRSFELFAQEILPHLR